jgi:hypothetical protein
LQLYKLIIYIFPFFVLSCKNKIEVAKEQKPLSVDSLLKRKEPCILNGEPSQFDSSKYETAWNAAYAYDYLYPRTFKDSSILIKDTAGDVTSDTSLLISPDNHATIKFWIGVTIPFPQDSIQARDILRVDSTVNNFISKIKLNDYPYLQEFAIDTLVHGIDGYYHSIGIIGHNQKQAIIYKIEVSVIPISGDLIFKNLVFIYDQEYKKLYKPMGITIANNFGIGR